MERETEAETSLRRTERQKESDTQRGGMKGGVGEREHELREREEREQIDTDRQTWTKRE